MNRFMAVCAALLIAGCASSLVQPPATSPARTKVMGVAGAQVGAPYKHEGADRYGFDASGLVYFSYQQAGFAIPRDVQGQLRAGEPVVFFEIRPADLLFYRLNEKQGGQASGLHVGLYVGDGRMVHAPLGRDEVVLETVDNPYWMQRLVSAVKLLP